ncbi:MAG: glycosyltransferase family 4 protein [Alphaproteobacteria bacterium]
MANEAQIAAPAVLQVVPRLDAGGVEQTTLDMARALIAAGGRAVVATSGGRLVPELEAMGASVEIIPAATKNPYGMAANILRLRHIAQGHRVDIVHARSRAPAWSARAAARGLGLPFVTTYHGIYTARTALKRRYNAIMASGDVVIANSRYTARHIAEAHGVPLSRIVTIPRGTDMTRFDPAAVDHAAREALRADWGAKEGERVILLPARLTRWKGQEVFLDALALLSGRDAPPWRAVLAGDHQGRTDYRDALTARAEAAGIGGRVHLAGHVADMPLAYAAADLVISPAVEPEAFGRVAVEAQAMAKPVIVADHGGATETVKAEGEGVTGWRTPPGDAEALARAMAQALALTPEERAELGARARAFVAERFSVGAMTRATLDVYRGLMRRRQEERRKGSPSGEG